LTFVDGSNRSLIEQIVADGNGWVYRKYCQGIFCADWSEKNQRSQNRSLGYVVGYIKVSSCGQNTDRQLADFDLDKIFEKKAPAKGTNRPVLQECLDYLREGVKYASGLIVIQQ